MKKIIIRVGKTDVALRVDHPRELQVVLNYEVTAGKGGENYSRYWPTRELSVRDRLVDCGRWLTFSYDKKKFVLEFVQYENSAAGIERVTKSELEGLALGFREGFPEKK